MRGACAQNMSPLHVLLPIPALGRGDWAKLWHERAQEWGETVRLDLEQLLPPHPMQGDLCISCCPQTTPCPSECLLFPGKSGACPAVFDPLGFPMPCFCCSLSLATWRDVDTYPTFPISGAPAALIPGDTHPALPSARCSPQLEVCRLGGVTEVDAHHHAGRVPWRQALWNHRAATTSHIPTRPLSPFS